MVAAVIVHAVVLSFIFPKYYDPLWPFHSDMYLPNAAIGAGYDLSSVWPYFRPFTQLLMLALGNFGITTVMLVLTGITLWNAVMMARVIQLWLGRPVDGTAFAVFLLYCTIIFSHPFYYISSTPDFPSGLSLALLLAAMWSYLGITHRPLRYLAFTVFAFAGFLSKETYSLSFPFIMAALAAGDIFARRPIRNSAVPFFAIASISAVVAIVRSFLMGSTFVGGEGTYAVDVSPWSILENLTDYIRAGLPSGSVIVFLVGFAALLFVLGSRRAVFTACVLVIAGLLALIPNSTLPDHHMPGYSWNAAMFLFAPILLVPAALAAARRPRLKAGACAFGLILFAVATIGFWETRYDRNTWSLQVQMRQKRLLLSLQNLVIDPVLTTGAVRVLVSGMAPAFSPFENGYFFRRLIPNPDIRFDVVLYDTAKSCCGTHPDYMKPVRPEDVDLGAYDVVWVFKLDGTGTRMFTQVEYPQLKDAPFDTRDMVLYPELQDAFRWPSSDNADADYQWLACGGSLLTYAAPRRALQCLDRAQKDNPTNLYPLFYAGGAWEMIGDNQQALENYTAALALSPAGRPNWHLEHAIKRIQKKLQ